MKAIHRQGISAIEVVVIIMVVLVVAFLSLPSLGHSLEASRRARCKNNLKQIGLALHNYHDVYGMFPPGQTTLGSWKGAKSESYSVGSGFSWGMRILPFMDSSPIYNSLNLDEKIFAGRNRERIQTLSGFSCVICPSDVGRPAVAPIYDLSDEYHMTSVPQTSYFGNSGPFNHWSSTINPKHSGGMFGIDYYTSVSIRDVHDGTSNTIIVSEADFRVKPIGSWLGVMTGCKNGDDDCKPGDPDFRTGSQEYCLYLGVYPLTSPKPSYWGDQRIENALLRSGSQHRGGAHCLFADGSVHFMSETIQHFPDKTNSVAGFRAQQGAGCLWTNGVRNDPSGWGCSDQWDESAGHFGVFDDKSKLPSIMGLWQRLHHKSDGMIRRE